MPDARVSTNWLFVREICVFELWYPRIRSSLVSLLFFPRSVAILGHDASRVFRFLGLSKLVVLLVFRFRNFIMAIIALRKRNLSC